MLDDQDAITIKLCSNLQYIRCMGVQPDGSGMFLWQVALVEPTQGGGRQFYSGKGLAHSVQIALVDMFKYIESVIP